MSKNTIYLEACNQVVGFQTMGEEFIRKLVIEDRARSTHENYLRQMSKLALHYDRTPLELDIGELEEYLYFLIQKGSNSLSAFKHLVCGHYHQSTGRSNCRLFYQHKKLNVY